MDRKEIPDLLELAQTLLGQWIRYRQFFIKGIAGQAVTPDEEQEFLQTASSIAQNVRKLGQRLDEKQFPFRQKEISQQLKGAISISYFGTIPETDQRNFYKEWHNSLIFLSRTVGALKFLSEGYVPPPVDAKGKRVKAKKGGGGGVAIVIVLILLALGGGIGALFFLGVF